MLKLRDNRKALRIKLGVFSMFHYQVKALLKWTFVDIFDYERYLQDFKIIKRLGRGGYGEVVLGQHYFTKDLVAIKKIRFRK
jgi:serine/threonine protein kinase